VVVAVLGNESKKPLFSVEERIESIRQMVDPAIRVESFSGLLVDFMDKVGARAVVRGLRAVSDFEYEFQMALMNRRLNPRVETVFMMPKGRLHLPLQPAGQGGLLPGRQPDGLGAGVRHRPPCGSAWIEGRFEGRFERRGAKDNA